MERGALWLTVCSAPHPELLERVQLLDLMWGPMMEALAKEPDTDVQSAHLDAVIEIVDLVGACVP
jgi:hypothetical protein